MNTRKPNDYDRHQQSSLPPFDCTCPYCAETISAAATRCPYCGMELPEEVAAEIEEVASLPPAPTINVRRPVRSIPRNNRQMYHEPPPQPQPSMAPPVDESRKRKRGCLRYLAYMTVVLIAIVFIISKVKPGFDISRDYS